MSIHIEPIIWTVRLYEDGKSFENKDDYIFVATVIKSGRKTATIRAGLGKFPLKERKEILRLLKETADVEIVKWIRSNGKEVEFKI